MNRRDIARTKSQPVDLRTLPAHVFDYIASIRDEAVRYRHQRNEARREVEVLRAELETARNA
ncbi:hypothetical protein [Rhodococcus globerulus]|uniref:hypothetical protein n=1 Tax=Rhodococcus globerulus TaxID=33008 RepID=UPI00301754DE